MLQYDMLTRDQVRSIVEQHIRDAEQQHLATTINAAINEESARVYEGLGKADLARKHQEAAKMLAQKGESFLRGIHFLKERFAEELARDETGPESEPPVPPVTLR